MDYGSAIKSLRINARQRQKEVCGGMGITQSWLSSIESGRDKPSLDFLEKAAKHFQVPLAYLFQLATTESDVKKSNVEKFRAMNGSVCALMKEMYL
jgi:transcriptional regulator with XRE-family HTH domain